MTMGFEGQNGVRNSAENDCQEILDTFFSHGHTEVDTARIYGDGTTEQVRCLRTLVEIPIAHRLALRS